MFAPSCKSGIVASDETTAVAYAKMIDVSTLDPALESQPLEEWLRVGPAPMERIEWQMSDCDLKPDYKEPAEGYPLCVRVPYQRGRVSGWMVITIGTKRKGVGKPPRFEYAVVSTRSENGMRFEMVKTLSDLSRMMTKLLAER